MRTKKLWEDLANKGLNFADFVRLRLHTYKHTQQFLPPLWAAIIFIQSHILSLLSHRFQLLSLWPEGEETLKYSCVCRPPYRKFNIASNDHWPTRKCNFFVSDRKYPFWENLVQNIKIVILSWNLIPRLIWICRIQWWCSLFYFRPETPFLLKFGPKNQNCQFKMKFGT